jgi:Fe-S-cluster containining protein
MADPLREAVYEAATRVEVREAVGAVYRDIARAIEQRKPVCVMSGRCCRFEEYGHRLYVTTMELACFVHDLKELGGPERSGLAVDGGCRFQVGKRCGVHAIRPFGCRIFFCDSTAEEWQQSRYEEFHGRLKSLHDSLSVPYFYVEWRQGLEMVLSGTDNWSTLL